MQGSGASPASLLDRVAEDEGEEASPRRPLVMYTITTRAAMGEKGEKKGETLFVVVVVVGDPHRSRQLALGLDNSAFDGSSLEAYHFRPVIRPLRGMRESQNEVERRSKVETKSQHNRFRLLFFHECLS